MYGINTIDCVDLHDTKFLNVELQRLYPQEGKEKKSFVEINMFITIDFSFKFVENRVR